MFLNVAVVDSKDRAAGISFRSFAGVGAIPRLRGFGYAGNGVFTPALISNPASLQFGKLSVCDDLLVLVLVFVWIIHL